MGARAKIYLDECSYVGTAPVPFEDYLELISAQTIATEHPKEEDLRRAFADLLISERTFDMLGPAINSGRGLFLYGFPGNGKTSIAERITRCFGTSVWIPRAVHCFKMPSSGEESRPTCDAFRRSASAMLVTPYGPQQADRRIFRKAAIILQGPERSRIRLASSPIVTSRT